METFILSSEPCLQITRRAVVFIGDFLRSFGGERKCYARVDWATKTRVLSAEYTEDVRSLPPASITTEMRNEIKKRFEQHGVLLPPHVGLAGDSLKNRAETMVQIVDNVPIAVLIETFPQNVLKVHNTIDYRYRSK